jgi:hypothetical protein
MKIDDARCSSTSLSGLDILCCIHGQPKLSAAEGLCLHR